MSLIPSFFGGRTTNLFDPFSLDAWDPFIDLFTTTAVTTAPSTVGREAMQLATARIDWKEMPEVHVFKVDVSGLKKGEVKGQILQISGERSREKEEKTDVWHRVERGSGRFRLPETSKLDKVKASMENGVLTVTVPKEEGKKAAVKAVDIYG